MTKIFSIRSAVLTDASALAEIYNPYIRDSVISFEITEIGAEDMRRRLEEVAKAGLPWLVSVDSSRELLGYAYAAPWKPRIAYRHSVESTIYLAPNAIGRGVGRRLYAALLDELRARSIHAVMGGIALPNQQSVALHERLGFRKVAHFDEVGFKQDRWIDVGYWQLLL